MKPRNKKEREVTLLSECLPLLYDQEEWAKNNVFSHEAFKCKDELWCSDCGYTWINVDTNKLSKTECPYCHQNLTIKVSRKQKNREVNYIIAVR